MKSRARYGAVVAAVGMLLAGCGGGSGSGAVAPTAEGVKGHAEGGYPVAVDDCMGVATVFDAAPAKIVTSNASSLELLLRLGAGEKVIGTGFPPGKGALPGELDTQAQKVPVLGRSVIPKEKLLGSGADLYVDVFAATGNMGGMGDAPTEEEFKAAGIRHIHLKSTACASMSKVPAADLSAVEQDIPSLGAVTGTMGKAKELVAGMKEKTDGVAKALGATPDSARPTYFFFDFDAGTKQPVAVCNRQVANAVITLAGARNVFADCDADFKPVSWEDVVSRNPDWIQLGIRNQGSEEADTKAFDEARKWLEGNPAAKGMKAVRAGHFLRIRSEHTTIAGVDNAATVEEIARTVHPDRVKER
ncbi:ABC transporter substrate-binding protein [Streptomyces sp. NPDC048496]|uniref:ABC transporter substrate-binding protein n=1 Tax=Streptomyces sp. NPDC048496 TaxID=3365558 RepID=UPI00371C11B9